MSEGTLQNYFVKQAKLHSLFTRKLTAVGHTGFPDRLIAGPGGYTFVELKSDTRKGTLSKKQILTIKEMNTAGLNVTTAETREEVDEIIKEITSA